MKRHFSPAEVLGIVAIAIVVFCAWLYSILLEFQFFVSVTPTNNPIFPYLGLAFTGIGFALWGIGFLCARKPFTQIICMIMGLASGGTAFTIAYMEFTSSGDKRYGITADPATYKNALLTVGIMFVLNLISLALKAIVWRFSQHGTGFFQPYNPDGAYLPTQQPQYQIAQPKEADEEVRMLQTARASRQNGTSFLGRLKKGLAAYNEPTGIPLVDASNSYPSNREEAKAHYRELKAEADAEKEAKAQIDEEGDAKK